MRIEQEIVALLEAVWNEWQKDNGANYPYFHSYTRTELGIDYSWTADGESIEYKITNEKKFAWFMLGGKP